MEKAKDQTRGISLVRLDAVAAFVLGFSTLGGGWNSFRARIHRARRLAGIRRTVQRSGPPIAADLLLSTASAPSFCALEPVADWAWVRGAKEKQRRLDSVSPYQTRNILAGGLEFGRPSGDVVCSVETDRSHFSDRAAALFAAGGCCERTQRKTKNARRSMLRYLDRARRDFHERLHGSKNLGGESGRPRRLRRFRSGSHKGNGGARLVLWRGRRGRRGDALVCSAH